MFSNLEEIHTAIMLTSAFIAGCSPKFLNPVAAQGLCSFRILLLSSGANFPGDGCGIRTP
jgi:hypothetical protein